LRAERDEIDSQRLLHSNNETELVAKHSELQGVHTTVLQKLATVVSEKDTLAAENSEIQAQAASALKLVTELQGKLVLAAADLAASNRQLHNAQNELKSAGRRAEEAEQTQKDLQAEGTNLMRSLNEMRSKFVELTGVRSEQGERIDSLEHAIRGRDATIAQLEVALEEVRDEKEQAEKRSQEVVQQLEKERLLAQSDSSELHNGYVELQNEFDIATASLHNLEAERSSHHQEAARRIEEIERLNTSSQAQSEELDALRKELNARRDAQVSPMFI
jgi:chromosome segregation ATPase